MDLGLSGLASGFDWNSLVDQLTEVERAPERRLLADQDVLGQRNNAYGSIKTQLSVLQSRVDALNDPDLFNSRLTQVGDETVGTAAVSVGAALGNYTFSFSQLATAAAQQGAANVGGALNPTNDVSGLVLGNAGFSTAVTAGVFSVNGQQVSIDTTDTLQQVFDKIDAATGRTVSGSYDPTTDAITLSSGSPIILGTATDTSNFLQVGKLNNNGTGTISSSASLGSVRLDVSLANANLATAISDGGAGAGAFMINGVTINFDAATDSLTNILDRINSSAAGVTANYDVVNDRFILTNKATGDMGIALQDITGNFLTATSLSNGTLKRGNNLLYSINGGGQLVSQSNTISESSSGLAGLSVTALKEGSSTTVQVTSDTEKIKKAINDFLTEYNKAQSMIDKETASTTNSDGKVTAGMLASESDAYEIASRLRGTAFSHMSGLTGSIDHLADLGIDTNGNDNALALSDSDLLDEALTNSLSSVKEFFTDSSNGLATRLNTYLHATIGDDGTLVTRQNNLTKESSNIDQQIADLERVVQANREQLINSFVAMETAQAKINQQLQFLAQRFPS